MRLARRAATILSLGCLALLACGGSSDDDEMTGDPINPEGEHYAFVYNNILVPTTSNEATSYGVDIDGDTRPDNKLGLLFASLATTAKLDIAGTVSKAVIDGSIILLSDVQATDLTAATGVGLRMFLGDTPSPAPCTDPEDETTCGKHLNGGAMFSISASSPTSATLGGSIVGGRLTGGPGEVTLELPLAAGSPPIEVTLIGARAEAGITETALADGRLGGAIKKSDIEEKVLPAVGTIVGDLIAKDCTGTYPDCCADPESTGAKVLSFLNPADSMDCQVSLDELKNNSLIASSLLSPDLDLLDAAGELGTDGTPDSISLCVGFSGVSAVFSLPAE